MTELLKCPAHKGLKAPSPKVAKSHSDVAKSTQGYPVNAKRVARLLHTMGLETIYTRPKLSQPNPAHHIYPYALRGVAIERVDQVWSTDITFVRLRGGFVYLVAVKYEEVYLNAYETPREEATQGLRRYFEFCNGHRLHQALAYRTPAAVYFGNRG